MISRSWDMLRVKELSESEIVKKLDAGWRWARVNYPLVSQDSSERSVDVVWNGKSYKCGRNRHWTYGPDGTRKLAAAQRVFDGGGESLGGVLFWDDWPYVLRSNLWDDVHGDPNPIYVVQTSYKIVERCLLMATDPGDLVLDPTCGSGTTAFVAEQWGRRWITIDTSRIALSLAKARLLTATFPYYKLHDETGRSLRQGFQYKTVPHVTLKSIANNESPGTETLYDQPLDDKKKLRVTGPFTVETLQNYEPLPPAALAGGAAANGGTPDAGEDAARFERTIFEMLKTAGIKNGDKKENAIFSRVDRLASGWLHAEGFYKTENGEGKAYLHIGPKFGTVSKRAVNEAIKECRTKGDANWLVILGFSFESDIENRDLGGFMVTKARMHDDLMQEGLLKRDKKAAAFVTIGEPDIHLRRDKKAGTVQVEIRGLDIYDPVKDEVKARELADIAYWMLDDDYDGSNFIPRQIFFCGSEDKDEFSDWNKGLLPFTQDTKRKAEKTLRVEIDYEAFARLYGHLSHPVAVKDKDHRLAVRLVSQFGEECTKVIAAQ